MRHYNQDFLRRLPDSDQHFRRGAGLWQRLHLDPVLLLSLLLLTFYGLIVLYSGGGQSEYYMKRQVVFFAIAYAGMLVVAQVQMHVLQRWAIWLYAFGILLLIWVMVNGVGAKGAQRWISLGFIRFQPSEIVKLAVPIMIASYFSTRVLPPRFRHVCWCVIAIGIPAGLIVQQPDLGTSLLVVASGLIALFLAGLRWRYVIGTLLAAAASIWPMWQFVMHDYQKQRVLTLLNPEADPLGAGWNIIQSKTAIGSGGLYGKGWLSGTQSHLDFLPESHTDFIIAVLAEEFGLLGVLVLLGLYIAVISRGLTIAVRAQTTFNKILAGSISLTFSVYVFVNMGMVAGLLPVVGVPLPLVSLGGTSLVTLMVGFGILMAIATERKKVTM